MKHRRNFVTGTPLYSTQGASISPVLKKKTFGSFLKYKLIKNEKSIQFHK